MLFLQTPLSILLQVPTLTPEEIEQRRDSVRQGAQQMIEFAKTDPHGFWQTVGETMLQFGLKVKDHTHHIFGKLAILLGLEDRRFALQKRGHDLAGSVCSNAAIPNRHWLRS